MGSQKVDSVQSKSCQAKTKGEIDIYRDTPVRYLGMLRYHILFFDIMRLIFIIN